MFYFVDLEGRYGGGWALVRITSCKTHLLNGNTATNSMFLLCISPQILVDQHVRCRAAEIVKIPRLLGSLKRKVMEWVLRLIVMWIGKYQY